MTQLVNKISAKDILGNINNIVKGMEIGDVIDGFGVGGICSGYETGVSTYGEWVRFTGELEAINYITGEVYRSSKVHLPGLLEDILKEGIIQNGVIVTEKSTKTTTVYKMENDIEFSYKVDIERMEDKENGAVNYKYHVKPMTEIKRNDKISHLINLLPKPDVSKAEAQPEELTEAQPEELTEDQPKVQSSKKKGAK